MGRSWPKWKRSPLFVFCVNIFEKKNKFRDSHISLRDRDVLRWARRARIATPHLIPAIWIQSSLIVGRAAERDADDGYWKFQNLSRRKRQRLGAAMKSNVYKGKPDEAEADYSYLASWNSRKIRVTWSLEWRRYYKSTAHCQHVKSTFHVTLKLSSYTGT